MWAAYSKGAFPGIVTGLTQEAFVVEFGLSTRGRSVHVLRANNKIASQAIVGVVISSDEGYRIWPVVAWFPWASKRNRIECAVRWLQEARKSRMPVLYVDAADRAFGMHLCRYGVIRPIGPANDWNANGSHGWLFRGNVT